MNITEVFVLLIRKRKQNINCSKGSRNNRNSQKIF